MVDQIETPIISQLLASSSTNSNIVETLLKDPFLNKHFKRMHMTFHNDADTAYFGYRIRVMIEFVNGKTTGTQNFEAQSFTHAVELIIKFTNELKEKPC